MQVVFFVLFVLGTFAASAQKVLYTYYDAYDSIAIQTPVKEEYQVLDADSSIKNGYYYFFSQNRDTMIHCFYSTNKRNGLYTAYYESNIPKYTVLYKNDVKVGEGTYYSEDGAITATETFVVIPSKTTADITYTAYTYFNKDEKRVKSCFLYNDLPDSIYTEYYPSGNIKITTNFTKGIRDGSFVSYFENGTVAQQGAYSANELNGTIITYFPEGSKKIEAQYKNGILDGLVKQYYKNGKLFSQAQYIRNTQHGLTTTYYSTGVLQTEEHYSNGMLNGFFKTYYNNGTLETESVLQEGKKQGLFKNYNKQGQLLLEASYSNGELNGDNKGWFDNGQKKHVFHYKNGVKIGENSIFFDNGLINTVEKYNAEGTEVKIRKNFVTGAIMEEGEYLVRHDATGNTFVPNNIIKEYFQNGQLKKQTPYTNGKVNGEVLSYFENGQLYSQEFYAFNVRTGIFTYYHSNGKIAEVILYKSNKKYGAYKSYYETGLAKITGNYTNDKKHGEWKFFDEAGKLLRKEQYKNNFMISEKTY